MKRKKEEDQDFDPVYAARWRAQYRALYCAELKKQAAAAGLLESPFMREKISAAEEAAAEAERTLTELKHHDTRTRARGNQTG